jgi:GNAT superfamily N-acetyltransferase
MARQRSVALRPLRAGDIDRLAAWLPRAAAEAGCERWADAGALRDAGARVALAEDGHGEAFVEYESGRRGDATVRFLAVEPGRRRLGIGYRTVLALEERLAATAKRCYVAVPARLGLALYFWLRLGYRPLTQADWPRPPGEPPATWMARELR